MTHIPSGPANRRLAEELYAARVEEHERQKATDREAWLAWETGVIKRRLQALRAQIDSLKKHGGDDATEALRRLGKEHYDLTGADGKRLADTDGGASGPRPSTADLMRAARQAAGIETPLHVTTEDQDVRQERRQRL